MHRDSTFDLKETRASNRRGLVSRETVLEHDSNWKITGQWEHEKLAKVPFKVYRHPHCNSAISNAQFFPKYKRLYDRPADITASNYHILSTTDAGEILLTDINTGLPVTSWKKKVRSEQIPEITKCRHFLNYNESTFLNI